MKQVLELLITLTVAGSTVVGCILLLRLVSSQVISAKWRYSIGKMAVWFYLLPVAIILQWLVPFWNFSSAPDVPPSTIVMPLQNLTGEITAQAIPVVIAWAILILWGIGAIAFAIWQMYCYHKFLRKMKKTRFSVSQDSESFKQLTSRKKAMGIKGIVQFAYHPNIKSPVLVGLLKPTILLPMNEKLEMDLSMVIHHELVHLKRKDLWIKLLVLCVSAIHWFNPLVHMLRKEIHIYSELSCDEEVVKDMSYAERKKYGETILNVMAGAKGLPVKFCASLSGDGKQLKRRLMIMLNTRKMKKHTMVITAAVIIVTGAIGTSSAVWASKNVPEVKDQNQATDNDGVFSIFQQTGQRTSVTVKSEGVIERDYNYRQPKKQQDPSK